MCVSERVGGLQMCSMYAKNGQNKCHTRAPLLFIPLQPILVIMSKLPTFCEHMDDPCPLVIWYVVQVTTSISI
jgi:hypothetical protein